MALPPVFEANLLGARMLTPNVRELTFERVDARAMAFEPGQWVNAVVPAALATGDTKRSYSIASAPDGSSRLAIAVTRVQDGPGSNWLHSVAPGTVLPLVGPQGFFTRPAASSAPALMIATGTGVTPMRSMVRAAVAAGSHTPLWLVLGVRREEDLLYADEFSELARQHSFIRFEPTLSQPGNDWQGRRGYVQAHVRELWDGLVAATIRGAGETVARANEKPHVYVCGLQRMVGSVRDMFRKDMGVPRQQVHSERYD